MSKRVVYTAGPMTNRPYHNAHAFIEAAADLRARGYQVVSPFELDNEATREACLADPTGSNAALKKKWSDLLRRDLHIIAKEVTDIAVLDGWAESRGARLEVTFAVLLGIPIRYARSMRLVPKRRLAMAFASIVQVDDDLLSVAANR